MKNKRRELLAWVGVVVVLTILVTSTKWLPATVDWLKHSKPPETEQVAPISYVEVKQQVLLEQVKKANGSSVLIKTEKLGDNVVPLVVRHYARWTELGEIEYWTEQVSN